MRMTILFIFLVSISIASANSNPSSGFFFEGAFIDAKHKAGEEGKLFFVDFYANWCTPCKWMEESTFKNAEVINMLSTNYVALKIDIDDLDGYSIKQQFQVSVLPTILIFNSKGELIERVEETLSTGKMLALLEYHNKDDNKVKIKHAVNSSPKVSISSLSNERVNNHLSVKTKFKTASDAFNYFFPKIMWDGVVFDNTRALFNVGFYIEKPMENTILAEHRAWNPTYAEREWDWYLSGNPNAEDIAKKAPIWYKMMDSEGCVRSNYGWQWQRNNQLDYVCAKLKDNPDTRHAAISIYDAKEWDTYRKDTPCTYAVQFTVVDNKLNMCVVMRSNDLWYGFCNDQYCFSKLQELVSERTGYEIGTYYHFAHNLHLYNDKITK